MTTDNTIIKEIDLIEQEIHNLKEYIAESLSDIFLDGEDIRYLHTFEEKECMKSIYVASMRIDKLVARTIRLNGIRGIL